MLALYQPLLAAACRCRDGEKTGAGVVSSQVLVTHFYKIEEQIGNSGGPMVPLYAARIEDLGPGGFVKFECAACGHDALIPPSSLLNGLRLPPYTPVLDLERRLRCRECDQRGKATVSIRWAAM